MRFARIGITNHRIVSMNVAQKRDPRVWKRLRELGLVDEPKATLVLNAPVGVLYPPQSGPSVDLDPSPEPVVGESESPVVFGPSRKILSPSQRHGHQTILVWNEHQRVPASLYAKAMLTHCRVTIEVSGNASERLAQLGEDRAMIYRHA